MEKTGWWRELRQRDVLLLTSAHFFANVAGYGFIIWLPSVLSRAHGFAPAIASALSALPFGAAIVGAWLSGRSSDRTGERKLHACLGFVAAGSFLVLSTMPNQPTITALGFTCLTGAAFYSWVPPFWVLPTQALTASAAAAAIGLINSVGNLGGFVGPSVTGLFFAWKLPPIAAMGLLSARDGLAALLTFFARPRARAGELCRWCGPRSRSCWPARRCSNGGRSTGWSTCSARGGAGLSWLLFPAVVTIVMGFFLERIAAAVEARIIPEGARRAVRLVAETVATTVRLMG